MANLYDFSTADSTNRDLLGGKGAGLAAMTQLGLPVPPGFTISTDVSRHVLETGDVPESLWEDTVSAIKRLEAKTDRSFGPGSVPLLVSVRSGSKFSMPGMMDTVLNLGMNDKVVEDLISWSEDPHFAWDVYRRFVQMYGSVVLKVDEHLFQNVLSELRAEREVKADSDLTAEDLESATRQFQALVGEHGSGPIPEDPQEQLQGAVKAVFDSWGNKRAYKYRELHGIPDDLGTAANVQMMVFGDMGDDSGTGVCFTRDPATGKQGLYGDYLPRAQGEDVVSGARNTLGLDDLSELHPECHSQLLDHMEHLENHYRDMMDIEFTIEKDVLYILQARVGKRTAEAAVRLAVSMANEGLIEQAEAVNRVDPGGLEQLHRPRIAPDQDVRPIAKGVAASPGAASGVVVFDSDEAVARAKEGENVILVRPETTPDDIHGMAASTGILTSQGGKTSHAAVVARGMGKPAVTGAGKLRISISDQKATTKKHQIKAGDRITIDGTTGAVYLDEVELVEPEQLPELSELLAWSDSIRTLDVWANADTPSDAALARERGAQGIGLARTEHMFMGERLQVVQRIILASSDKEKEQALAGLELQQVDDFEGLLEAMDGLPVVIRLLDPPLHEFLPSRLELEQESLQRVKEGKTHDDLKEMSDQVAEWEEDNPMLGLRGVRLGLMLVDLYRMQARAAVNAVCRRLDKGGHPVLEIMIPLVAAAEELRRMRELIEEEIEAACERSGHEIEVPIGTMIELPRAALTAGEIAAAADFFSFGTNDLTQMTFGLSRDDAESLFLGDYLEQGILDSDPFQTLDQDGVGRLVRLASVEGRRANPDLKVGVCGEHGGDPASIAFFRKLEVDYVSCSPPRVEGARLAAAQAELNNGEFVDSR